MTGSHTPATSTAAPVRTPGARGSRPALRRAARGLGLAVLLVGGTALAYVLPQSAVLRRMVERRDEQQLVALRVDGSFTLSGEALKVAAGLLGLPLNRPEAQTEATFAMKVPGRCRLEAGVDEEMRLVAVHAGGRGRMTGAEVAPLTRGLSELCTLMALRASSEREGRAALDAHLRALGVEARQSSLARFGGKVAYVLGNPQEDAAQLWVYKDNFQPARLRWKDRDGTAWDVWMVDYTSPATGEAFPRVFEVYQNGQRQLRFSALKGDTRVRLDDALFSIQEPASRSQR
jgi:hypothetical protein